MGTVAPTNIISALDVQEQERGGYHSAHSQACLLLPLSQQPQSLHRRAEQLRAMPPQHALLRACTHK